MKDDSMRPPPLFVGDHAALDFLNTLATPVDSPVEWLTNGADLVDWLLTARMIDAETAGRFRGNASINSIATTARELREWFRAFVQKHAGQSLAARDLDDLQRLNGLLADGSSFLQVQAVPDSSDSSAGEHALHLHRTWRYSTPDQLLQPIAEAMADLVCHKDFRRIHACEGKACTLLFLDKTKSHKRRWCSMGVCGNRTKAAAHRARIARRSGEGSR